MEIVLNYFTTNQFATVKQYFTNGSAAAVAAMVAAGADGVNTTFEPTSGPITPATTDQKCFYENTVYSINDTNFDYLNELFKQKFNDASVIISVVILILINFIVIAGNILVIVSVFVSTKLRTVTNFFIVSLAVADFLVGIAVLPYSLTLEILDTWIFGEIWCQGWLVIDVWTCTASILNLCAISVDRYLAVTQPVRYRSLMTAKRAKIIIAAVWIVSFIICFPPLVVRTTDSSLVTRSNLQQSSSHFTYQIPSIYLGGQDQPPQPPPLFPPNSTSASSPSSSSSIPSLHELSKASLLNSLMQSSISNETLLDSPQSRLNHTRKSANTSTSATTATMIPCKFQPVQCALFSNKSYVIYSAFGSFYIPMFVMIFFYWRIYLVAIRTSRALKRGYRTTKTTGDTEERLTLRIHRGYVTEELDEKCTTTLEQECRKGSKGRSASVKLRPRIPITIYKASRRNRTSNPTSTPAATTATVANRCNRLSPSTGIVELNGKNRRNSPGCQSTLSLPTSSSPSSSREGSARSNKVVLARLSKRTSKYQAKRFHAETKAAKTVGIIVGGFIVCWLPFFTAYLTRAFCEDCIPELLFSIFFWLGYCNSMINPCIYGLFSRDFRRAFRNILCRCKFREETSVSSLIRQIHMPTFFEDMPEELAKQESQDD